MTRETESAVVKVVWSLVTAALLGLAGWVYTVGNRVTAVETDQKHVQDTLHEIRDDVRSINSYLRGDGK